jgi:hypothetical protein
MTRPKNYVLGSTPEIRLATTDTDGNSVSPTLARLTIDAPDGTTLTISGGVMTDNVTYLSYVYSPTVSGFFMYEAWVEDSSGNEASSQHGFYVVDRVL